MRRACFVALVLLPALAGCSGCEGEIYDRVAEGVAQAAPDAAGALRSAGAQAPLGPVDVYVDLSLSMRPYLGAAVDQTTPFYRLLETLNDDLGADVDFYGFGFLPADSAQRVDRLSGVGPALQPGSYTRVNNDYAALFGTFVADSSAQPPTRVVVTDGVESDPEGGRRFGEVVGAADRWVRRGGVFAALAFRTPYAGRYFSEGAACAGGAFEMQCDDRPLVAFVFAPDAARLEQLEASLEDDGIAPTYVLRVGAGDDLRLTPVASLPPPPGERRGTRLLRDTATVFVQGYRPFMTARVDRRAVHETGFFPLTFDVDVPEDAPWGRLSHEEQAAFLGTLRPVVRAWAVESSRDTFALHPVDAHIEGARVDVLQDSTGAFRLQVVVPVRRPPAPLDANGEEIRVRHFAWLVSVAPFQSGQRLVPDDLSTLDDCASGTCGRTLNLARLLGAVLKDDYVPGRALLLTEWRE